MGVGGQWTELPIVDLQVLIWTTLGLASPTVVPARAIGDIKPMGAFLCLCAMVGTTWQRKIKSALDQDSQTGGPCIVGCERCDASKEASLSGIESFDAS